MLTSGKILKFMLTRLGILSVALLFTGLVPASIGFAQTDTKTPTTITISDTPITTNAKRLGVNLGTQDFWDSGMIMRNLSFRNPGFEAETWQSTLHCLSVTANSCTDDNLYNYWPAAFLNGASAEFIYGPATGSVATVTTSTAAVIGTTGVRVNLSGLSKAPSVGDYIVVRMTVPGNAQAGWWPNPSGGATVTTETKDLSPNTPGKQALSLNASGSGQQIYLSNYDDGLDGRIFLKMAGNYNLSFRAKGTGGSNQVVINLVRNSASGTVQFWKQTVNLTNSWQDYSFDFSINNDTTSGGAIALTFNLYQASMLIDDVAFTEAAAADNPTEYRNAVVSALKTLHPGTLRYMDSGINWGSSIDNILAPDFARMRTGYSPHGSEADDIAMGLHGFLVLCQTIGAEPWYTMPTGMTTQEMTNLMEYLGGSASTPYGAKRAAQGQTAPWTTVFPTIHLEFGNEVWNTGNPGANMTDQTAYGTRAATIFATAKASPNYAAKSFDLVLDGFEALPYWTAGALAASSGYDTVDVASYNFNYFNDGASSERIFGPMLAEPEYMNDNPNGLTALNAATAASAGKTPAHLAVYETNVDANQGSVSQAAVNTAIPSLGAGLSVAANMLLAQRDAGVTVQNMFALEGLEVGFYGSLPTSATKSPIWGVTVDMGGATDLRRPMFLSEQLANMAILPTLFATSQSGSNPTWNQPLTTNDNFALPNAHFIQSLAYSDGTTMNIVLFNMSRTSALPVNFAGLNTPTGSATVNTLTAASIDANNETQSNVAITTSSQYLAAGTIVSLPPHSMTVLSVPAPHITPVITGVTATCADASLSPDYTTNCTAAVTGQGKYDSAYTWSTDTGTISSEGVYKAPSTVPANKRAVITATSNGNSKESAKITIAIQPNAITGVTASCASTSVGQGQVVACKASVQGTGSYTNGYTWSTTGGSITSTGSLTAPATGTSVTLTATSTQDTSKSAQVKLAVTPVLVISDLTYSVTGTTATISWKLNMDANSAIAYGATPGGGLNTPYNPSTTTSPSFTLTGLKPSTTYYLAPYSFMTGQTTKQPIVITTTNGDATVTGVTMKCAASSLAPGASTGCSASVSGSGSYSSAVNWSTSAGTISNTGVLTTPTSGSSVTVTATSVTNSAKSASFTISLSSSAEITGVALTCKDTTITDGSTTTCTPTVTSTGSISTAVTFTTTGGTISSTGVLTAPKTGKSVTVTATSVANPKKSASVVVTLSPLPTITGVMVTCQATSLSVSGSTPCASSVTGTGSFTPSVTWSTSGGSITSAGVLTAPATGTSVTIKATSTEDPSKSGTAVIALTAALAISDPKVTVTSTSVTVTWTVNSAQANSAVSYSTAGSAVSITPYNPAQSAHPSFTLTGFANSTPVSMVLQSWLPNGQSASMNVSATTSTGSSTITSVAVYCSSSSVQAGNTLACAPGVKGTGSYSTAVNWSTSGGSITTAGILTAPKTGSSVVVKATSVEDPSKFATTTITVTAPSTISAVSVVCSDKSVQAGSSLPCSAGVTGVGSFSTAVTWSASAGSVNPAGLFTASTTSPSVTLTATSVQDPTKSGTATIAVGQNIAIVNPTISLTPTTIVVSWSVTEQSHNAIKYGLTTAYGLETPYQTTTTMNPSFTFTGLTPGTTYKGLLESVGISGTATYAMSATTPLK